MATNDIIPQNRPAQNPILQGSLFVESGCALGLLAYTFVNTTLLSKVCSGCLLSFWEVYSLCGKCFLFVRGMGEILMKITVFD